MSTAQRAAGVDPAAHNHRVPTLTRVPTRTLRRCGGVTCPPGTCNHEDEPTLRRHSDPHGGTAQGNAGGAAPPIVHEVLRSPGRPLDAATRQYMEPRFGHDFSDVRVHSDARAAESARAVQAHAYTVGHDVVLGSGRSTGDTGRRTLAHELTHVVQQAGAGAGTTAGLRLGDPADAAEREAEAAASHLDAHPAAGRVAPRLQRIGDPSAVPAMSCPMADSSPANVTNRLLFPVGSAALTVLQKLEIAAFVHNWRAAGGNAVVRVDGHASSDGPQALNWALSCDRAKAVEQELTTPALGLISGVPPNLLRVFAHGEGDELGSANENRQASIATSAGAAPPRPACPAPNRSTRRTGTLQPVVVADDDGTAPTPAAPLGSVQTIWRKCCTEWTIAATVTVSKSSLKTLDIRPPVGGAATAEETELFTAAGAPNGVQVITVDRFFRDGVAGKNVAGGGKTYDAGTASPRIVVVSGVAPEVVAHEVGHATGYLGHDANATVMQPTGAHDVGNPTAVSPDVCTRARGGSALTATATDCCLDPM